MKPILLIQTGGTIGSVTTGAGIDTDARQGEALLEAYASQGTWDVSFEVRRPFTILSENMMPGHWRKLAAVIAAEDITAYQGIIVTCGSDTLPYTAAALSYVFAEIPLPLLLVCANRPLDHPASNGLANFAAAVDVIMTGSWSGVFVPYRNSDGVMRLYLGTRLKEADPVHDDFSAFGGSGIVLSRRDHEEILGDRAADLSRLLRNRKKSTKWPAVPEFTRDILALKTYPGLNYRTIDTTAVAACLHVLYHGATANGAGPADYSLPRFIEGRSEVDHYLISFKEAAVETYITTDDLLAAGGIPLRGISFEAALTKLYFAYNQGAVAPRNYMEQQRFFEFVKSY